MKVSLSLVVVAFRSSAVLPEAVRSFRREADAAGVTAEVVVVEQSEIESERAAAAAVAPEHCLSVSNRGYAAGINAGFAVASGDVILFANPDVVFLSGSLAALSEALSAGFDIVGPQFTLGGCLFPPADVQTPWHELRRRRALASRRSWERYLRRDIARSLRVWAGTGVAPVDALSGALIAARRDDAARVGAWNEDYFLYFEETDWLRRASRLGLRAGIATGARVAHRWGHAADPRAPSTAAAFERSRRIYYETHFGRAGRAAVAASGAAASPPFDPPLWDGSREEADEPVVPLLSPSPAGFHAARIEEGGPAASAARIVAETGRREPYYYLTCDRSTGAVRGPWLVPPPVSL